MCSVVMSTVAVGHMGRPQNAQRCCQTGTGHTHIRNHSAAAPTVSPRNGPIRAFVAHLVDIVQTS